MILYRLEISKWVVYESVSKVKCLRKYQAVDQMYGVQRSRVQCLNPPMILSKKHRFSAQYNRIKFVSLKVLVCMHTLLVWWLITSHPDYFSWSVLFKIWVTIYIGLWVIVRKFMKTNKNDARYKKGICNFTIILYSLISRIIVLYSRFNKDNTNNIITRASKCVHM